MVVYEVCYLYKYVYYNLGRKTPKPKPETCKGHFVAAKPQSGEHREGFLVIFVLEIKELIYMMNHITPHLTPQGLITT